MPPPPTRDMEARRYKGRCARELASRTKTPLTPSMRTHARRPATAAPRSHDSVGCAGPASAPRASRNRPPERMALLRFEHGGTCDELASEFASVTSARLRTRETSWDWGQPQSKETEGHTRSTTCTCTVGNKVRERGLSCCCRLSPYAAQDARCMDARPRLCKMHR